MNQNKFVYTKLTVACIGMCIGMWMVMVMMNIMTVMIGMIVIKTKSATITTATNALVELYTLFFL